MAETLEEAIVAAKVAAGLDPDLKYPAYEFHEHIEERWRQPFWEHQLNHVIADDPLLHDFVPVAAHPDDDECTYRADCTDATYCGKPASMHVGEQEGGQS